MVVMPHLCRLVDCQRIDSFAKEFPGQLCAISVLKLVKMFFLFFLTAQMNEKNYFKLV